MVPRREFLLPHLLAGAEQGKRRGPPGSLKVGHPGPPLSRRFRGVTDTPFMTDTPFILRQTLTASRCCSESVTKSY